MDPSLGFNVSAKILEVVRLQDVPWEFIYKRKKRRHLWVTIIE